MSALFRNYAAVAAAVIDQIFGEPFVAFPMAFVGGKFVFDTGRAPAPVSANLTEKAVFADDIGHHGARAARNIVSEHATQHSEIEILASALPYDLKAKDRLQRAVDGVFWEIQGVQADDLDHVTFRVTMMGPLTGALPGSPNSTTYAVLLVAPLAGAMGGPLTGALPGSPNSTTYAVLLVAPLAGAMGEPLTGALPGAVNSTAYTVLLAA